MQDHDPFVSVVRGSFSNVVGLPIERLETLLQTYPWLGSSRDLADALRDEADTTTHAISAGRERPWRRPARHGRELAWFVRLLARRHGRLGVTAASPAVPAVVPPRRPTPPCSPIPAPIDGKRAYGYLKQICEIGPRTAGSAANARQRKLVADISQKMGGKVREQPFTRDQPVTTRPASTWST